MQRITKQRKLILEELQKLKTHPTAQEIFDLVKDKMPGINLATVYRTLDALERNGLILKLYAKKGEKARYDGYTGQHCHLVCKGCSGVMDIFDLKLDYSSGELESSGFKVIPAHLELPGFCKECQEKL
jgi:Fur family transcriptional regulator, ferric uptake regulator